MMSSKQATAISDDDETTMMPHETETMSDKEVVISSTEDGFTTLRMISVITRIEHKYKDAVNFCHIVFPIGFVKDRSIFNNETFTLGSKYNFKNNENDTLLMTDPEFQSQIAPDEQVCSAGSEHTTDSDMDQFEDDDCNSPEPNCEFYMEKPLLFIETQEDGKMTVNQEVLQYLRRTSEGIHVIAIAGKYRTGKSYLMNRLFKSNSGFELGSTIQAKTKGIWIWAKPHPLDPKKSLILLDTEGLYDVKKGDECHDMKLFSLAVLLSKSLVYNAVGTLDDVIMQQLHLVSELTEHIHIKASGEEEKEDGGDFHKYFPSFFLLLRDFFLDLEIDGELCSASEYMEDALKLKQGTTRKVLDYNTPRMCIANYFPMRNCFTLCKPVDSDEKLKHMDQVTDEEIRPEFLKQVEEASDVMISEAREFDLEGNFINGERFFALANEYVQKMNSGEVPSISGAVESLKHSTCTQSTEEALQIYEEVISESVEEADGLPLETAVLYEIHENAYLIARDHFFHKSIFDEDEFYLNKLEEELEKRKKISNEENNKQSELVCKILLESTFTSMNKKQQDGCYSKARGLQDYVEDKNNCILQYNSTKNKGPMAEIVLNEFLKLKEPEENAIKNAEQKINEVTRESGQLKVRIDEAENEKQRLYSKMILMTDEHSSEICKLESANERQIDIQRENSNAILRKQQSYEHELGIVREGLRSAERLADESRYDNIVKRGRYVTKIEHLEEKIENLNIRLEEATRNKQKQKPRQYNHPQSYSNPPSYYCYEGSGVSSSPQRRPALPSSSQQLALPWPL